MKPTVTKITKIKDCIKSHDLEVFDYLDNDDFSVFKIEDFGLKLPFQSHTFRPEFFSLIIILDAKCTYEVGNESYQLTRNNILFIKPELYMSSYWLSLKEAYHLSFSPTFLTKYGHIHITNFSILSNTNGIFLEPSNKQIQIIKEICKSIHKEAISSSYLKYDKIGNLLVYLLLKIQQFKDDKSLILFCLANNKENDIISTFLLNMERNFSDLALGKTNKIYHTKDYASKQNVDKNYLSKVVSKYTGKTISSWIREKTIDDIKYLLKHSNNSLREISLMYGFNDLTYFYSYFRKHTGYSPHNFRKSIQKQFFSN